MNSFLPFHCVRCNTPGLHLTLGIYMKMFTMLENYTGELDSIIAVSLVAADGKEVDLQSCKYVFALENEILELEENCVILPNEIDWEAVSENDLHDTMRLVDQMVKNISEKMELLDNMSEEIRTNVGPCQSSLDGTLKTMCIERHPHHCTFLFGNQCHKLLKNDNIETSCNSVPALVLQQVGHGPIYEESIQKCNIFKTLFTLYSKCHVAFNTADVLSDDVITTLEVDIVSFMSFLLDNWPEVRITPKLQILEDHVASFLRPWHAGCEFYGEQGE